MKKIILVITLLSILVLAGCQKEISTVDPIVDDNEGSLETFVIDSELVDCVGVGPMKCMVVNGNNFYDKIEGFEFEPGFEYTLKVSVTEKSEPIPADSSKYEYTLVEVVEKNAAEEVENTTAVAQAPLLRYSPEGTTWNYDGGVLTFQDGRYMMDFGCNKISGSFTSERTVLEFGIPMITRMACSEEIASKELTFADLIVQMDTYGEYSEGAKLTGNDQDMILEKQN